MNICGTTKVTYEQAMAFAKSKKATTVFINNARIYWNLCKKVGINPCVAYCQYALESGWGKFGGVLDASYCNPCGLKNTAGGSCTDPKAHKKFKSWESGISAHIDHLALYAGVKGYPKSDTEDPRHFPYLLGTVKTVEKLAGTWAMTSSYSKNLIKLVNSLESYKNSSSTNTNNSNTSTNDTKETYLTGTNFKVRITTSILNIRKAPSFSSAIVGTVKKGQVFTIIKVANGLGQLKSGVGFISMNTEYVEKVNASQPNTNTAPLGYKVRVINCTYVNARKGPANLYPVGSVVKAGTVLTAISETTDGWIKLKSGLYIYKKYLKRL